MGARSPIFRLFGPQFGLKMGEARPPRDPPLDPPLESEIILSWWFNNTNERKRQELFFHVLRPTFYFCICRHSRVVHQSSLMKTIPNFFPKFVGWNWRGNIFHHNLGKRTGQNLFQPVSIKRIWRNFVGTGDGSTIRNFWVGMCHWETRNLSLYKT